MDTESTRTEWIRQQNELRARRIANDQLDFSVNITPRHIDSAAVDSSSSAPPVDMLDPLVRDFVSSRGDTASFDSSFEGLRYVGGVDIGFDHEEDQRGVRGPREAIAGATAVAVLVVLELPTLKVVYKDMEEGRLTLPYIPTFLAFRELPLLLRLFARLRSHPTWAHVFPQVVLVDGNGILHPRMMGLAAHLGIVADVPTIGVAKNFLHMNAEHLTVDGVKAGMKALHEASTGAMLPADGSGQALRSMLAPQVQEVDSSSDVTGALSGLSAIAPSGTSHTDFMPLIGSSGQLYGVTLLPTPSTTNPIFVSPGHRVSARTTLFLAKKLSLFRIPEPVRQADKIGRLRLSQLAKSAG
ncbi:endonuclease V [Gonapodya prolifera JEL478]|uniref:Endonuclease V n=1 Tax=Gonapodya prolifera (strain JEL478) TaxID=1344416 RepID=A0A139A1J2_GONPJ|nr:endonuclease V [Gonapodya prolifera JEL478]|eukprot:KXS10660.1 endonuclease V [Gonapodya prolifera JEL478]